MDEERIRELASALLVLAHWYEGDEGDAGPLIKARAYLETFPLGQEIIEKDEMNILDSSILS